MQDQHRLRQKVELSLDTKQIFLIFGASALVISLVFALGVVVGKRVTPAVPARPATDPLALLDQLGGQEPGDENLSFETTLAKKQKAAAAAAKAEKADPPETLQDGDTSVDEAPKAPSATVATPKETPKPVAEKLAKAPAKTATDPKKKTSEARATESKKLSVAKPSESKKSSETRASELKKEKAGTYSLQLSSFQERTEAEQFVEKLRKAGMKPQLTPAAIPGRGTWYRVRLGTFPSWEQAVNAKQSFERNQRMIAYVTRH